MKKTWRAISFSAGSKWEEPWWTWRHPLRRLAGTFSFTTRTKVKSLLLSSTLVSWTFFFYLFLPFLKNLKGKKKRKRVKLFLLLLCFLSISQTPVFMYSYLKKREKKFSFGKKKKKQTVGNTVIVCFLIMSKTTKSCGHMTSIPL